jgi:ElaA protein
MQLQWIFKYFTDLTPAELYAAIQLRNAVFVVEQNCVFQDADDKDQQSFHLLGWVNNELAAYVRIIPQGIYYEQASIGRVVTAPKYRREGLGKLLMAEAIERTCTQFNTNTIKIGAQSYLQNFYQSLGFVATGHHYIEDNIPHMEMVLVK